MIAGSAPSCAPTSRHRRVGRESVNHLREHDVSPGGAVDRQHEGVALVAGAHRQKRAALRFGGDDGVDALADFGAGGEPQLDAGGIGARV